MSIKEILVEQTVLYKIQSVHVVIIRCALDDGIWCMWLESGNELEI